MNIKNQIFKYIDEKKTLVFPNQLACDSWAYLYAKEKKTKAVFLDKLLSWDSFKDSCKDFPKKYKKADEICRIIFVEEFLKKNNLPYLCPLKWPQAQNLFSTDLVRMLPQLKKTLEYTQTEYGSLITKELKKDIENIAESYEEFLEKNSLYESSYIKEDFSKNKKDIVFVFPDIISDSSINTALKTNFFEIIENTSVYSQIKVFKNSLFEIRYVLEKIRKLLCEGEHAQDIVITVCDTSILPWIISEAERRNIKVNVVKGQVLSSFNSGKFFTAVKRVVSENWSVESVRDLLLNPCFPFKDRKKLSDMFLKGVENRVETAPDASSWVYKLGMTDYKMLVQDLKNKIQSFENAHSIETFRQALHAFEEFFFKPDPWNKANPTVQSSAYSRCMKYLETLENSQKSFFESSTLKTKPFDLFLKVLNAVDYNPVGPDGFINIYVYPMNAAVTAKHLFAIGFDDESTRRRYKTPPFCEEREAELGDKIINAYAKCGADFSCALENYSSAVSVPLNLEIEDFTDFTGYTNCANCSDSSDSSVQKADKDEHAVDSFKSEEFLWKNNFKEAEKNVCSDLQKKWFFLQREVLNKKNEIVFDKLGEKITISATAVSNFIKCPYKWFLSSVSGVEEPDYSSDMTDAMGVGSLMHECLEDWLAKEGSISCLKSGESQVDLQLVVNENIEKYSKKIKSPYRAKIERLKLSLLDDLKKFATAKKFELFEDMKVINLEKAFEKDFGAYSFKGRIDCVLQDKEGRLAIIDFKKSEVDNNSFQLEFYAKALQMLYLKKFPEIGSYYSVSKGSFVFVWENLETLKTRIKELDAVIEKITECLRERKVEATPSENSCKGCSYRSICRKRYVIK